MGVALDVHLMGTIMRHTRGPSTKARTRPAARDPHIRAAFNKLAALEPRQALRCRLRVGLVCGCLRQHSASLLHTPAGCRLLYDRLGIHDLTRPDPADWSIRHTSEASCKICHIYEHDLMEVSEGVTLGETVHNCMSCSSWCQLGGTSPACQTRTGRPYHWHRLRILKMELPRRGDVKSASSRTSMRCSGFWR